MVDGEQTCFWEKKGEKLTLQSARLLDLITPILNVLGPIQRFKPNNDNLDEWLVRVVHAEPAMSPSQTKRQINGQTFIYYTKFKQANVMRIPKNVICFVCDVNVARTNYSARTRRQQRTYDCNTLSILIKTSQAFFSVLVLVNEHSSGKVCMYR
uniref:Uncharacterized protein n=1 Tax=Glossina palpalis gambiensis TaxID=67801 RepID=A0A1B0AU85_9MUSC